MNYIWNYALMKACDKGLYTSDIDYFNSEPAWHPEVYVDLKAGDIVWVKNIFMTQFCQQILPTLCVPIVLLICDGDEHFPSDCNIDVEALLANPNIIHIFAQNCDYGRPRGKISHIPIGIDFHTVAYRNGGWGDPQLSPEGQVAELNEVYINSQPFHLRKQRAFVDFQHSDTMRAGHKRYLEFGEDRKSIFELLQHSWCIEYGARINRSELWKKKSEYAFSISPHGNGYDCHRTWEDLALGCIVIVKKSPIDPLYAGLPVVIVKDWEEITQANLETWADQFWNYRDFNPEIYREKLTSEYWISKMQDLQTDYRSIEDDK